MANILGAAGEASGARRIDRIVIAEGARDNRLREIIEAARRARVPVRREPRVSLDRLTNHANHQGVLAVTSAASYSDADDLLTRISPSTVFILLDGVEDPHNLGAIIRTAECGGASAVIVPERRAVHLTEAVAKTSAGAVEHLPVARVTSHHFIEDLKTQCWVVGVESSGQMTYTELTIRAQRRLCLAAKAVGFIGWCVSAVMRSCRSRCAAR
jgi:23S rRNA (guanosine2251-2'-O)-methyltransferase